MHYTYENRFKYQSKLVKSSFGTVRKAYFSGMKISDSTLFCAFDCLCDNNTAIEVYFPIVYNSEEEFNKCLDTYSYIPLNNLSVNLKEFVAISCFHMEKSTNKYHFVMYDIASEPKYTDIYIDEIPFLNVNQVLSFAENIKEIDRDEAQTHFEYITGEEEYFVITGDYDITVQDVYYPTPKLFSKFNTGYIRLLLKDKEYFNTYNLIMVLDIPVKEYNNIIGNTVESSAEFMSNVPEVNTYTGVEFIKIRYSYKNDTPIPKTLLVCDSFPGYDKTTIFQFNKFTPDQFLENTIKLIKKYPGE